MKMNLIGFCAVVLLTGPMAAAGQKTEVSVQKGKVIAETGAQSVAVEPGWKAVLMPGKEPILAIDDPLVDDVMEIYKWVEAEKQEQKERIDSTGIFIYSIEKDDRMTFAALMEFPNPKAEPSHTFRLGQVTPILTEPKFYSLQGRLLPFDMEKVNEHSAYYDVQFPAATQPGDKFRFILVSKTNEMANWGLQKEGPLWILSGGNGVPNCLNYYRAILPPSAVFVDSSRPVTVVDSFEGRVAVTVRDYTGPLVDSLFRVAFLWPEKDGVTLADLPARYRGLEGTERQEVVQEGRRKIVEILAGQTFDDQSTPISAFLSLYSAAVHRDAERLRNGISSGLKSLLAGQMDQLMSIADLATNYQLLDTPDWPQKPENGYEHPVYLARKGSLICDATMVMVHENGKWYLKGIEAGRTRTGNANPGRDPNGAASARILTTEPNLSAVTYKDLQPGKFMRRWLMLGPIDVPWHGEGYFPDETAQKKAFDAELLKFERFEPTVIVDGKDYRWVTIDSDQGVVDLTGAFPRWYVTAYLWAQIDMDRESSGTLGIGSDDAIRVWLNGRLVHENWTVRGVIVDNDRVPVTFKKGINQLVLQIQNGGGPWGFCCKLLEQ